MKAIVIFHSVCANTYLIAKEYEMNLLKRGIEVDLFRVEDEMYEDISMNFKSSKEYREEILKVNVFSRVDDFEKYDFIFMGSPTYYGNVSYQMKRIMDKCSIFWVEAKLSGKYFGCFTTCGNSYGGSTQCLQAMNIFAQHMGMILISVPSNINKGVEPAYGIAHETGGLSNIRIGDKTKESVRQYIDILPI